MKETKLYVVRIFNFCTQRLSNVTGFATNTVLQTEWSPVRHRKYLAWTQRSDVACRDNRWEIWHPMWSIPWLLFWQILTWKKWIINVLLTLKNIFTKNKGPIFITQLPMWIVRYIKYKIYKGSLQKEKRRNFMTTSQKVGR